MRLDLIVLVFCYIAYLWSLYRFCGKILADFKINKRIVALILFGGGFLAGILNEWTSIPYIFKMLLSNLLFACLVIISFRADIEKKIFTAIVLIITKTLVWNFGCSFLSCIFLVGAKTATGGQTESISFELGNIIGGMAYCMVIFVLNTLKNLLTAVFDEKMKCWCFTLSIPLVIMVLIVDFVNWGASNGIMVVSNANGAEYWSIYYNQIFSHTAICLLTILVACISFGFVFSMNKIYIEQKKKEHYHSKITYYKMLNKQYLQMERLRHDLKNHVISLYGLWKSNDWDKLGNYLEKMTESGNIGTDEEVTGNKVIDALLYDKKQQAEQKNVKWECDVQVPKECFVDEFDLCVLFGNILDNALNASKEAQDKADDFISIQFHKVKGCLLLVVKNETGMKDIKEMKQGIGFLNINETVKKYDGIIRTKAENRVFEISILLPVNNATYGMKMNV